ncbi:MULTISPECIES: hypothetical protein [unclassified Streptomyces]|uniref:hypothetical protein n=1 Tax=unclassified Streptomyces TaxID=2593676 RepID=UPI0022587367|nr:MULTISPECIES: hypothetical protein [unclassified Streptomyces]MCX4976495.1 hypothetical protein [Streptomyces sp. NBC_00620]WRZ24364.1 hypothetical protein OHT59_40550 [Streptomyces sp. NBC_00243]
MSTPTPAPAPKDDSTEQAPPADAPFDPLDFPSDLLAAQLKLAELYAALQAHQAALPWSRESDPGWPDEDERGRERPGRPATSGWQADDAAEFDRLLQELRKAAWAVQGHRHWGLCTLKGVGGADLVTARQALKHADGAVPLRRDDVATVA